MDNIKEVVSTIVAKNDNFKDRGYPKNEQINVWVSKFSNEERIMVYPRQMHNAKPKFMVFPSISFLEDNFHVTKHSININ